MSEGNPGKDKEPADPVNPFNGIDPGIIRDVLLGSGPRLLNIGSLGKPTKGEDWFSYWYESRYPDKALMDRLRTDPGMWSVWPEYLKSYRRGLELNQSHAIFQVAEDKDLASGLSGNEPAFIGVDYADAEARIIAYYDRNGQLLYTDEYGPPITPETIEAMLAKLRRRTKVETFQALYSGRYVLEGPTSQDPGPFFKGPIGNRSTGNPSLCFPRPSVEFGKDLLP